MHRYLMPFATLALCAAAAHADTVTFSLVAPSVTAAPGSTLDILASSIAPQANTSTEYLNGLIETFTPAVPSGNIDDADFFYTTYTPLLAPGDSFTGALFSLLIPSYALPGSVLNGTVELQGGPTPQFADVLARATLQITVAPTAIAATPEPGSLVLFGTGTLAMAWLSRRRLFTPGNTSSPVL